MIDKRQIVLVTWPDGVEMWAIPGPMTTWGINPRPDDWTRWRTMTELTTEGRGHDYYGINAAVDWAKANGATCEFAPRPPLPPGAVS